MRLVRVGQCTRQIASAPGQLLIRRLRRRRGSPIEI